MARKSKLKLKTTDVIFHWNDCVSVQDLSEALAPFGIVVNEHPALADSDNYGFIFSNRELTEQELKEAAENHE